MDAAAPLAPDISAPLTWALIRERYPDQHVCLVDIDRIHPGGPEFRTARVVACGKSRREAIDQARGWLARYREIGLRFTGTATTPLLRPSVILDDETRDAIRIRR